MVLLDTCTLIWLVENDKQLPLKVRSILEKNHGAIYVSAISAFEVGIKHARKKLKLPLPPEQWFPEVLEFHGLTELALTSEILLASTNLPQIHSDPADRMIIATAAFHEIPILTPDQEIRKYKNVKTLWN